MTNTLKNDIKTVQSITFEAYKSSGQLLPMLDGREEDAVAIAEALEKWLVSLKVA